MGDGRACEESGAPADPGSGSGSGGRPPGGGPPSHRPSRNHRRIVAGLGGRAGPPASRDRRRRITSPGSSPEAKHCSASRRRAAQEYEPGHGRTGIEEVRRDEWIVSARDR